MNSKTQEIIEAARKRTAELLAKQTGQAGNTSILPSAEQIKNTIVAYDIPFVPLEQPLNTVITINNNTFDPYQMEVGRANAEQSQAIKLFGIEGASGCLIGPAGTGKTTTMRALLRAAILSGRIPILSEALAHKYIRGGLPGIFGGSFTRIATRNLRNNFPEDLQKNVHTIHRLLEFEPEIFEVTDEKTGKLKKIRIFKPTRNKFRSLDPNLCVFCLDESSMIGLKLHTDFINAIHPSVNPQIIYIGDIAQLPPVMDDAILGYKMIEFIKKGTLVELKQVYRHAGAIVNLANHIRVGNTIPGNRDIIPYTGNLRKLPLKLIHKFFNEDGWKIVEDKKFYKEEDGSIVTIQMWKNRLDGEVGQLKALQNLGLSFFPGKIKSGEYDPMKHMILMPYNKAVGTIELNKYIAQYLSREAGQVVHEVIAGFNKVYLAVGDKVFYDREEAVITKININALYAGRRFKEASVTLDRWGHDTAGNATPLEGTTVDDVEMLLNIEIGDETEEERKNQASHVIHIKKIGGDNDEEEREVSVSTASEINGLIFGYALTIHKSQGSQWEKVYCIFHNSHNRNLQRELLYTAITRAQKELYIICEPETLIQGVLSQHIVGDTLEQKAEYFKGKQEEKDKRDLFYKEGVKEP